LFQEEINTRVFLHCSEKRRSQLLKGRRFFAAEAFKVSSNYDTAIFNYFNRKEKIPAFRESINSFYPLRYGENPHQKGIFFGDIDSFLISFMGKRFV